MTVYAQPRAITDVSNCYFYHTIFLPGIGVVKGDWDLNPNIANYLGNVDFSGKRVLDVGCATGVLSFYMEKQGADVVSFDLDKHGDWDLVPFAKLEDLRGISERREQINQINNTYWFAHRLLSSNAKVVYGHVYAIPDAIGPVDISVYGAILLHLRDPFLALQNGLKLTRETVIVTDAYHGAPGEQAPPYLRLLPNARTLEHIGSWWDVRPEWVVEAISILGFEDTQTHYHTQKFRGSDLPCFTVVGRRTHGEGTTDLCSP